jgi:hypothetical protein
MKKKIINTFPLLEPYHHQTFDNVDANLVGQRINWLQQVCRSSQETFVLEWMNQEPSLDAFHATLATILTMPKSYFENWQKMEIVACHKKIDAKYAHKKTLCNYYDIAIEKNAKDGDFWFKFPFENGWTQATDNLLTLKLARAGFPQASKANRYPNLVQVPSDAVQIIKQHLK